MIKRRMWTKPEAKLRLKLWITSLAIKQGGDRRGAICSAQGIQSVGAQGL